MADYPVLDGIAPSWADIAVTIQQYDGPSIETKDIAALTSGVSVEIGEQRGTGGQLRRRTVGQASYESSITFYRDGYQKFLRALAAVAPQRGGEKVLSLVHFDIIVQHIPPGSAEVFEYKVMGARLTGRTMNHAEGTDADQVECELSVAKIIDMIDQTPVRLI